MMEADAEQMNRRKLLFFFVPLAVKTMLFEIFIAIVYMIPSSDYRLSAAQLCH